MSATSHSALSIRGVQGQTASCDSSEKYGIALDDINWLMDGCIEKKPDIATPDVAGLPAFQKS